MRKVELVEANDILTRMMSNLLGTVGGPMIGRADYDLRRAVGDINAAGQSLIADGTLPSSLLRAFTLAWNSGATFNTFDRLRSSLLAETPVSLPAIAVTMLGIRYTLAAMSRIVASTNYTSRSDADKDLARINGAFEPAEEDAADAYDAGTYQLLVRLHGAVIRDLVDRSMVLPQLVSYTFDDSFPALTLSERIYPYNADTRYNELRLENKIVHPLFMPPAGVCLSA